MLPMQRRSVSIPVGEDHDVSSLDVMICSVSAFCLSTKYIPTHFYCASITIVDLDGRREPSGFVKRAANMIL
jgi:hypothetical protein